MITKFKTIFSIRLRYAMVNYKARAYPRSVSQVTTATAQLAESEELLAKAEAERASAEGALRTGKDQASMLEQKLEYTEAKAPLALRH